MAGEKHSYQPDIVVLSHFPEKNWPTDYIEEPKLSEAQLQSLKRSLQKKPVEEILALPASTAPGGADIFVSEFTNPFPSK